ncbi:MAG TPA: maleylpyruvate isomerase family mycothiol-dependent enzyme [Nakamurella sp.]|jgi:uncharacterized protein (TIGR03083 family)
MMTGTAVDVRTIPRITHAEAMAVAVVENRRFAEQLATFDEEDWSRPTDCSLWDVHAVAAHIVGSAAGQASPREFIRQARAGRPLRKEIGGRYWWDGMNEVQVRERATCSPQDLIDEWAATSARAVAARRKLPRPVAALPLLKLPPPVGPQPISYLVDMGFTRDIWAHRIDLARATGRDFHATPDHDGRIVADLIAEWAPTHGDPFTLALTGPAGGRYQAGTGGPAITLDAIEFVRTLAGRRPGTGVLAHPLPL